MGLLAERMRRPRHLGALAGATHTGAVGNPACGDVLSLHLRIEDGRIAAATFESMGSAYQLATASVLCDCLLGQRVDEARRRTPDCVLERLPDLPERYRYLGRLGIEALRRALDGAAGGGAEDSRPLPAPELEAFVLRLLGNGRRWSTRQIQAMAEAEGVPLGSPLRVLSRLRKEGRVEGAMDGDHRGWHWWLP